MEKEIIQAEQQLLGYVHGILGFTIEELLDSMNLSKKEWEKIKYDYAWIHNHTKFIQDIENYFLNKKNES